MGAVYRWAVGVGDNDMFSDGGVGDVVDAVVGAVVDRRSGAAERILACGSVIRN